MTAAHPGPVPFGLTVEAAALNSIPVADVISRAMNRHTFPWWLSADPYQILPAQLREPVLLVPFGRLLEAAALVFGREVSPLEFLDRDKLLAEYNSLRLRSLR